MKKFQLSIYYIQELNYRLAYTAVGSLLLFFTAYTYKQTLIFIILPKGLSHFVTTGLTEIFFTYMQVCSIISFSFAFITIIIQIFLFLRPGLYSYESKIVFNFLIGTILFYFILYIVLFPILIKYIWELFSNYSKNFTPIHLTFEPKLIDYLEHVQHLGKILSLSVPCIIALNLIQKYSNKKLWLKYRGLAYIVSFSLAAIITPPDVLSQTIVGVPLIIFYEVQIIFWTIYKKYYKKLLIRQPIKTNKNSLRNKK